MVSGKTLLLSLCTLVVAACSSKNSLQGPPVDLHALATPEPPAVVALPLRSVAPPVPGGKWAIWIPPQTDEQGQLTEGHWAHIDLAPPVVPAVALPVAPMPRTPKTPLSPKAAPKPAAVPVEPLAPSELPSIPNGALPSGMRAKGTNRVPLMQGLPTDVPPLPGVVQ